MIVHLKKLVVSDVFCPTGNLKFTWGRKCKSLRALGTRENIKQWNWKYFSFSKSQSLSIIVQKTWSFSLCSPTTLTVPPSTEINVGYNIKQHRHNITELLSIDFIKTFFGLQSMTNIRPACVTMADICGK